MKKRVYFRTNQSNLVGWGHFNRCSHLANTLLKLGCHVVIWLDKLTPKTAVLHSNIKINNIYDGCEFTEQMDDAIHFWNCIKSSCPDVIVVDDYRISANWENFFRCRGIKVVVLDDENTRTHVADVLVDSKWDGEQTFSRYQGKLNKDCIKLLGYKYIMADPVYSKLGRLKYESCDDNFGNILINIGGGGDWALYTEFLKVLVAACKDITLTIRPIIGPLAKNYESVYELASRFSCVQPCSAPQGLAELFQQSDFFITAAGGSLFEALAARIPCLSFAVGQNQDNSAEALADFGHYLCLDELHSTDMEKFAILCSTLIKQKRRILRMYNDKPSIEIDGHGLARVADQIMCLINPNHKNFVKYNYHKQKSIKTNDEWILEKVDDKWVHRYLSARNLDKNLHKMTETKKIKILDHFLWWFNENDRKSYVLFRHGKAQLIFWHKLFKCDSQAVMVGGWFICNDDVPGSVAFKALYEQLYITDRDFPGVPWVAVIKADNYFVQKMNERFGFVEQQHNSTYAKIAKCAFPFSKEADFKYFTRV